MLVQHSQTAAALPGNEGRKTDYQSCTMADCQDDNLTIISVSWCTRKHITGIVPLVTPDDTLLLLQSPFICPVIFNSTADLSYHIFTYHMLTFCSSFSIKAGLVDVWGQSASGQVRQVQSSGDGNNAGRRLQNNQQPLCSAGHTFWCLILYKQQGAVE